MKIAIISGPYLPIPPLQGGAMEKSIWLIAKEFNKLGHSVTIFSRAYEELPNKEEIGGIKILRNGGFNQISNKFLICIKDLIYAFGWISQIKNYDFIISTDLLFPIIASFYGLNKKVIAWIGRTPKQYVKLYNNCLAIAVPSLSAMQSLENVVSKKMRGKVILSVIPLIPDISQLAIDNRIHAKKGIKILYMGRIHPEKGVHVLINSVSHLSNEMNNLELSILGPYLEKQGGGGLGYLNNLQDIVAKNNINEKINFIEPIFETKKLHEILSLYDFFCYPSLAETGETFGLAIVEAMSLGLIPIVSDLDCFKDFIKPNENGFVFNHRQNPEKELINALKAAFKCDYENISNNAKLTSKNYTADIIANKFLDIMQEKKIG